MHWPHISKSLEDLRNLCNHISEFNDNISKLDNNNIVKYIEELGKEYLIYRLRGLEPQNFPYFMKYIFDRILPGLNDIKDERDLAGLLEKLCSRNYIVSKCKDVCGSMLDARTGAAGKGLYVLGGIYIGDVSLGDWEKHGLDVVIDAVARTLQKYCSSLQTYYREVYKLLNQSRLVEDSVVKALEEVKYAKFLPLKKSCRYLQ